MSPKPVESSSSSASPPAAFGAEMTIRSYRRPIPKKGHTKSRRGCHNCKRRKVKCQETRPECHNCVRFGLRCVYPVPQALVVSAPLPALQSTPGTFSMEDLRFFHHFLVTAYPPLPVKGDAIWKQVAALSHQVRPLSRAGLHGGGPRHG